MTIQWVKAAGDWELDVLGVPFGGPNGGKDAHGEWFDGATRYHEDKFGLPPVAYYHGYDDNGPAGSPHYIGRTTERTVKDDGIWYRVVLDKTNEMAQRVWDAAKQGIARASSGTVAHLRRVAPDGHIKEWPVAELSIFDAVGDRQPANAYAVAMPAMKAVYDEAGIPWPDNIEPEPEVVAEVPSANGKRAGTGTATDTVNTKNDKGDVPMPDDIKSAVAEAVMLAMKAQRDADAATAKSAADVKAATDVAIAAAKAEWEAAATKAAQDAGVANRLPGGTTAPVVSPVITSEIMRYDNIETGDLALMTELLHTAKESGRSKNGPSIDAYKSLAMRLESQESRQNEALSVAGRAMKMSGIKADELNRSTLASYGDEWAGIAYSGALWESIRVATFVASKVPTFEMPPGAESIWLPLESTDPIWYTVAQAASQLTNNPGGVVINTVTSSRVGTLRKQLTLGKLGARIIWTGEMEEDSITPFLTQLRAQLATSGAEHFESALIDGDTDLSASTNINDIAGTPVAEWFTVFDGFRKSGIITTTANSRDGGVLASSDFLETVKLMGASGLNGLDRSKVGFIIDPATHYKTLELADVKTRDVFGGATLESGVLTGIFGYGVQVSGSMNKISANRLTNTAGKIDQDTASNNTKGSILAVRWDQWQLAYRRRLTMETTRIPAADATEIVTMMRVGLAQRDTEAAAITYNLTV